MRYDTRVQQLECFEVSACPVSLIVKDFRACRRFLKLVDDKHETFSYSLTSSQLIASHADDHLSSVNDTDRLKKNRRP